MSHRNKVKQVYSAIRASTKCQNYNFCMNEPFKLQQFACTWSHVKTWCDVKIAHFQSSHNSTFSQNKSQRVASVLSCILRITETSEPRFWEAGGSETPVFVLLKQRDLPKTDCQSWAVACHVNDCINTNQPIEILPSRPLEALTSLKLLTYSNKGARVLPKGKRGSRFNRILYWNNTVKEKMPGFELFAMARHNVLCCRLRD